MTKEWQRHMAYEALVILGMLALLLFVCRLWPILLLVILGIFAAALRLVFLSSPKVQPIRPEQPTSVAPAPQQAVTNREAENTEDAQSFGDLQTQITRWVRQEYPNARWVWKYPDAKAAVPARRGRGHPAQPGGGYREAVIHLQGNGFFEIQYLCAPVDIPRLEQPEESAPPQEEQPTLEEAASQPEPPQPEDYSLLPLSGGVPPGGAEHPCNECIAQKQDFLPSPAATCRSRRPGRLCAKNYCETAFPATWRKAFDPDHGENRRKE